MKRYLAYLKAVLRHKRFVFEECLKLGVPLWIAILHDWDKFLPDEFIPYARCYYKSDGSGQCVETPESDYAWMKHQRRNKHHWQYWLILNGSRIQDTVCLVYDSGDIYTVSENVSVENILTAAFKTELETTALTDEVNISLQEMPDVFRREALADWRGAGRAFGDSDAKKWYLEQRYTVFPRFIHPDTLAWFDKQLGI